VAGVGSGALGTGAFARLSIFVALVSEPVLLDNLFCSNFSAAFSVCT
jgi:hypothetical protein